MIAAIGRLFSARGLAAVEEEEGETMASPPQYEHTMASCTSEKRRHLLSRTFLCSPKIILKNKTFFLFFSHSRSP